MKQTKAYRFELLSMDDREWWEQMRAAAERIGMLEQIEQIAGRTPPKPPLPSATDYLAASRSNDRSRLDRVWQEGRRTLTALTLRRCVLGIDPADPDDRLLDWLWGYMTLPTWTVSAHIPKQDLPPLQRAILDLACCEMAAHLAETRECLKPWMDSISGTLADSIIHEIDRRVLTPYGDGQYASWESDERPDWNNWAGVCAGSILCACESLAAQGHPRPAARQRAIATLGKFLHRAFTADGECDEGVMYWVYGVGMATIGWSRLEPDELPKVLEIPRLRQVATYPARVHLTGNLFYSKNDANLDCAPPVEFLPWLAGVTGEPWLRDWARSAEPSRLGHLNKFGLTLRLIDAARRGELPELSPEPLRPPQAPVRLLADQQAAILRWPTSRGEMLATLSGGHNNERHNHNDLGQFMIILAGRLIVPDIGNMLYTADYFGPRRYTYLPASSRGHCCPEIAGHEQRGGAEAAGRVLEWRDDPADPRLRLDLTAAYPPEAALERWERALGRDGETAVITDLFRTRQGGGEIRHVIWSLEEPVVDQSDGARLALGPIECLFSAAPQAIAVEQHTAESLRLRSFAGRRLWRIAAVYHTDSRGELSLKTRFGITRGS